MSARLPRPLVLLAIVAVLGLLPALTSIGVSAAQDRGADRGRSIDSQAVLDTLYQWAEGYDEDEPELMRDAFTDDATFIYASPDFDEPLVFEGIEEVMDLFLSSMAAQDDQRRHVMTNSRIERIDRHTVQVTSYLSLFVVADPADGPILQSTGVYRDTLVQERDGEWRIQIRDLRLDTAA